MFIKVITVTALNGYIKKVIDSDFILNNANVKGELSNVKLHSSGHIYFSLKDEFGKVNCVMFKSQAQKLVIIPRDGMNVIIRGRVSVYEKGGAYQVYCDSMETDGEGQLFLAFQNLKDKLQKLGLFDEEHKKILPSFPRRIGIVTSQTGAAVKDIINVATRRNANVNMLIYPALVQGVSASTEIEQGIKYFNNSKNVDLIILARGGGSIEELWAFNEENLAYAIYNSKIPIITGIGHETDFTIADFVCDHRAPTPSSAAEIAVRNLKDLNNEIKSFRELLLRYVEFKFTKEYNKISLLSKTLKVNNPLNFIVNQYTHIDSLRENLNYKFNAKISMEKQKLSKLNALMNAHNPLNVLNRGYAVLQTHENEVISEINILRNIKDVKIILKDGTARFNISNLEEL
ncbi:exodeoxyribonuclease VII large subunit [Clostridium estertheticum]|uniref:exodeoxyribonuclease VII large subunit n=1 Tax=Clostridium estertheticum TaxID=238834 RepID=UPI001CF42CF2|nr:exodeoxyribonuclease VII large subunit [Clostridium estertheticum]MCB2308035.1 exodeoxyribonuclease VII large subunit [Clostridium estertheticum]MCB2346159.1 exodeoxyribonuclease VII large subunit [Clostridium estertheticum]MCB2351423.1 exodeoxyribonuclease VII large subunit [Clostridium estertheticum]WAG44589.1 exodeoxyribonuclease VII large subunit [Clostridium estertheticum]